MGKKRKKKKRSPVPKQFEQSIIKFYNSLNTCYAFRIPDAMFGKGMSAPSPADAIACCEGVSYLIECKTKVAERVSFDSLSDNQIKCLGEFQETSFGNVSMVAVLMGYTKGQTTGRCFLINYRQWLHWKGTIGRKSIPLDLLVEQAEAGGMFVHELVWKRGVGWTNDSLQAMYSKHLTPSGTLAGRKGSDVL